LFYVFEELGITFALAGRTTNACSPLLTFMLISSLQTIIRTRTIHTS